MELTGTNYVEYDFSKQIDGSSFMGATLIISSNGTAVDFTDATIDLWWTYSNNNGEVIRKSEIGDGITVTDAVNGTIQIDPFEFESGEGKYNYEMKITLSSGYIKKYLKGNIVILDTIF